jgi:hypothetical protein
MAKRNDPKFSKSYLDGLCRIESNMSILYAALADRVAGFESKSLLLSISADGQRHSVQLRKADKTAKSKASPREGEKKLKEVFDVAYKIYKKAIAKEQISEEELPAFAERLGGLEGILKEKYVLAHSRVLRLMAQERLTGQETDQLQTASLDSLRSLLAKMIGGKDTHRRQLGTLQKLVILKAPERADSLLEISYLPPEQTQMIPQMVKRA